MTSSRLYMHNMHTQLIFKDGVFRPIDIADQVVDIRPTHRCSSSFARPLCVLDENGNFIIESTTNV